MILDWIATLEIICLPVQTRPFCSRKNNSSLVFCLVLWECSPAQQKQLFIIFVLKGGRVSVERIWCNSATCNYGVFFTKDSLYSYLSVLHSVFGVYWRGWVAKNIYKQAWMACSRQAVCLCMHVCASASMWGLCADLTSELTKYERQKERDQSILIHILIHTWMLSWEFVYVTCRYYCV